MKPPFDNLGPLNSQFELPHIRREPRHFHPRCHPHGLISEGHDMNLNEYPFGSSELPPQTKPESMMSENSPTKVPHPESQFPEDSIPPKGDRQEIPEAQMKGDAAQ